MNAPGPAPGENHGHVEGDWVERAAPLMVVVTGAAGFTCSYTMEKLAEKGYTVVAVDSFCAGPQAILSRASLGNY